MNIALSPSLWLDHQAAEAADFYATVFPGARVLSRNPVVVVVEIDGQPFTLINGGPRFRPNPSVSFFVVRDTAAEIDALWAALADGGRALMPLGAWPWSSRYGWVEDRYGFSWQLMLGDAAAMGHRVLPALMFTGDRFGDAEAAACWYTALFPDGEILALSRYPDDDPAQGGRVSHARVRLAGRPVVLMDSVYDHGFGFNEALSLIVHCDTQEELDHFWDGLVDGGEESRCGWLKDRFGFSWQIVPRVLGELLADPARAPRVTAAFLPMRRLDIAALLRA